MDQGSFKPLGWNETQFEIGTNLQRCGRRFGVPSLVWASGRECSSRAQWWRGTRWRTGRWWSRRSRSARTQAACSTCCAAGSAVPSAPWWCVGTCLFLLWCSRPVRRRRRLGFRDPRAAGSVGRHAAAAEASTNRDDSLACGRCPNAPQNRYLQE